MDEAEEGKVYTTTEGLAMLSAKEMVLQGKPIEEEEKEQEEKNAEQRIEEEKIQMQESGLSELKTEMF